MANSATQELRELRKVAGQLARAEEKANGLRDKRNEVMFRALTAGATEREAAEAGSVSSAYAHRVKVGKGVPKAGAPLSKAA